MFRSKVIPAALNNIVVPVYFVLLIAAAILAGLVIRQGIINARAIRAQSSSSSAAPSNSTRSVANQGNVKYAVEDTPANQERRRERRRNAAASRRRRAGKA